MAVPGAEIAAILESIANLLEIDDASPFRIRAYRNAADTIRMLDPPFAQMLADGEPLTDVQDVGPAIAKKIEEILEVGPAAYADKLEKESSPGLLDLLKIPGLGPKRIRVLREALGVSSPDTLRAAIESGRLREVPGFGAKTEEQLLRRLRRFLGDDGAEPSSGEGVTPT